MFYIIRELISIFLFVLVFVFVFCRRVDLSAGACTLALLGQLGECQFQWISVGMGAAEPVGGVTAEVPRVPATYSHISEGSAQV